jgi:hypothetical protein
MFTACLVVFDSVGCSHSYQNSAVCLSSSPKNLSQRILCVDSRITNPVHWFSRGGTAERLDVFPAAVVPVRMERRSSMFSRFSRFAAGLMLLWPIQASAASPTSISIQSSIVSLGGNVYRYVYSITNNGSLQGGAPIRLFDILFDTSLYQQGSLQIVTPLALSAQWSQQILSGVPPTFSPAYDALALQGGIPAGTMVAGFSVQFTWLGSGVPGAQPFQVYDPTTFQLLQTGQTDVGSGLVTVPAASTLLLILISIGLALIVAYQTRVQQSRPLQVIARLK